MEDFLYSALLGLVLLLAVFWFYFSYVTIPRIDKRMLDAGAGRACPVDIMGLRVFVIANAIFIGRKVLGIAAAKQSPRTVDGPNNSFIKRERNDVERK